MNPINNLVGGSNMAPISGNGIATTGPGAGPTSVSGTSNNLQQMFMHAAFDTNMASSVTLACCQSLCDVLTELPLPSAVIDKSPHTNSLINGLNISSVTKNNLLNDLSTIPALQQALYLTKQQINEITLTNNNSTDSTTSPSNSEGNSVNSNSVSNSSTSQQPSQLLHELLARGCFFNSPNSLESSSVSSASINDDPSSIYQTTTHSINNSINNNNSTSNSNNNLQDLNADLHTIEPSIDRHMTDLHQNLMNDLINDCDPVSTINANSSNDLSHQQSNFTPQHHHSHQHSLSSQQTNHHSSVLNSELTGDSVLQHQSHHIQSNMIADDNYSQLNHHHQFSGSIQPGNLNSIQRNVNDIKIESPQHSQPNNSSNYPLLDERIKNEHKEAAQKSIQAASTTFVPTSQTSGQQNFTQEQCSNQNISNLNSSNNYDDQAVASQNSSTSGTLDNNIRNLRVKSEVKYSSNQDQSQLNNEEFKPNISSKRSRNDSSTTSSTATKKTPSFQRRSISDMKPQIRSVKYSFSDADYDDFFLNTTTIDIIVRFEQIIDQILSTSCNDFNDYNDIPSDNEYNNDPFKKSSHNKKKKSKSSMNSYEDFDNHVNGLTFNVTIDAEQIKEIMILSAKIKQSNRVNEIERKKLILFLTVLSNQLNLWFTRYKSKTSAILASSNDECNDYEEIEERAYYWELCCNASQSALHIMTSTSNQNEQSNLISLEELIEVTVDFISHNLSAVTHVTTTNKSPKSKSTTHQVNHFGVTKRHVTRWTQLLQLLFEFINLRTKGSLTDTLILSLTRISMSALFLLQNTAEMQFVSIEILCHVFEEYPKHRISILEELLNSLSKIPTKKSHRRDSVLTQMLIRLTNAFFQPNPLNTHTRDSLSKQSTAALQVISSFLSHFLRKCHQNQSTNNSDVDFKLIFESLLNDLLDSIHSPHKTASILIIQVIIKLLISYLAPNQNSKQQNTSLSARLLAIEYLSIVCSKFAQFLAEKDDTIKELSKTFKIIDDAEGVKPSRKSKQNVNNENQFTNKLWNHLVDYFNSEKLIREKLVLASIWSKDKFYTENEQRSQQFFQKLNLKKVKEDNGSIIDISTAALCIQYMEFVHFSTNSRLFDISISHVTASLSNTSNTTQRSRAMKCLSNILSSCTIDKATQLLSRTDLQNAMRSALLDPSTSVREATVDLIGRFVLQSKDQNLCQRYSDLIGDRILDTGVSVRKRVIKILRDFCIEFPEFEKCGEMAVKIVRRINDDGEGIRRLVVDTCRDLWFTNTNSTSIKYKVYSLLHVIASMINDNASMESMQSLFDQLIKNDTIAITQQICDSIVNDVLIDDMPQCSKITQLSAVQCLAMISQCCPELMVKHCDTLQSLMSLSCETLIEISLRMKLIQTIERVLPHINNPSPYLLTRIEEDLTKNILQSSANIIQCSVKCLSILIKNHTKNAKLAVELFSKFQQILYQYKNLLYEGQNQQQVKPKLLRAIYTCGLFAKYFSTHIQDYKDRVRDTFIELILSPYDVDIKCKSIVALGFVIESDPKICLLPTVIEIYTRILKNEYSDGDSINNQTRKNDELFCIQVLNNFRNYLSESIESDENAAKTIEWARESLKSMTSAEDDSSSTQSQIIQRYLSAILINSLNPNLSIRRVACNVIHVIHSGGHVHPLQLVPHLVAMTCDDDYQIRIRADHVLHDIERKYHGYVAMKSKEAVNLSALFCKKLKCFGYRVYLEKNSTSAQDGQNLIAIQTTNKEICARMSSLYHVICNTRQSRRGFITSLLRHFDSSEMMVKNSNQNNQSEIIDIEFIAENILFFPYTVFDEILYILNQLECTSSINSTHVTQLFKEIFIVEKPYQEPSHSQCEQQAIIDPNIPMYDEMGNLNPHYFYQQQQQQLLQQQIAQNNLERGPNPIDIEDIDLENEEQLKKYENNIHVNFNLLLNDVNNERLSNLVNSLRIIYLSTLLRTLLKECYLLKDEKINDYSTNDSKTWEKPVHRRQIESVHLRELFDQAKPNISVQDSLLLSNDLSEIERQLLGEWRRFKQVSLNNSDPNFKQSFLSKLFQSTKITSSTTTSYCAVNESNEKISKDSSEDMNSESNCLNTPPAQTSSNKNVSVTSDTKALKTSVKKSKSAKKKHRKRVVVSDEESNEEEDDYDDDEDYHL
ncbi:hypothetical protein NH340_JMT05494 [Sarcoptes scabiei]|nr:hypothetical protein NH340_JMT05494 [Sarcoptes scabiei]